MAKVTPISEHFRHFLAELKETFWGDLYGQTKLAWQRFFELQSERQRDRCSGGQRYERRPGQRRVYRNGYYERDFVTRLGTLRLRIARTRRRTTQILRACNKSVLRLTSESRRPARHGQLPDCRPYGSCRVVSRIEMPSGKASPERSFMKGYNRYAIRWVMRSAPAAPVSWTTAVSRTLPWLLSG